MVQRLTYRRRHSYHTKSNRQRIAKTPGALRANGLWEWMFMCTVWEDVWG